MELKAIYQTVYEELQQLEKELKDQLIRINDFRNINPQDQKFIEKVTNHIFNIPGKRLRPLLVLLSGKAVNELLPKNYKPIIELATAVELLHSASLIHDDIIDESSYRRQQITLNKKFGNKIAVLVGDILYSQFFSILVNLPDIEYEVRGKLLQIFCNITRRMCFGEIQEEIVKECQYEPTLQLYTEILENKTASLMAVSCQSGAILAGGDEKHSRALGNYGLYLGLSYQIMDDYKDGDAVLKSNMGMIEKAKEYASSAKREIGFLKDSLFKEKLFELSDFVIEWNHVKI